MFWDHGNHGGVLIGLLLTLLGLPGWLVWTAFGLAWIATAYPDLAPIFIKDAWFLSFRYGDSQYRLVISFRYSWGEYNRFHIPSKYVPAFIRFFPFFLLHRVVDLPAHTVRVMTNRGYRVGVYIATALAGWLGLAGLILLRSLS